MVLARSISRIQSTLLNSLYNKSPNWLVYFLNPRIAKRKIAVTSNLGKHRDSLSISFLKPGGQLLYYAATFLESARFRADCPSHHSILRYNGHACRCHLCDRLPYVRDICKRIAGQIK